jgi:hypothetical protein
MPRGGARPGAGRKKKFVSQLDPAARDQALARIQQLTPELIEKMMELARGVAVRDENIGGKVYTRPPDRAAIQFLLDHSIGKPKEVSEVQQTTTVKVDAPATEHERAERLAALMALAKERGAVNGCSNPESELQLRLSPTQM